MPIVQDLVVDQFGAFVSKHEGRLRVSIKGECVAEAPLMHLERVVIHGNGVSLSSNVIAACCQEGIPIHFLDRQGEPYAGLYAAGLTGTVATRREQLAAYHDVRSVRIACALAHAKIGNQAALLRYLARTRSDAAPAQGAELSAQAERVLAHQGELQRVQGERVDVVREALLSIEGRAAQCYWRALHGVLPEEYGWPGREGRGAKDAVNAALNYGYGILYHQVEQCILLAGLDPYAGYVHADRPGKPSLVHDLIEPFRVPAVDRVVFGLANRHTALTLDEEGLLVDESRKLLAGHVLERLEKPERYEGKRVALRAILQSDARHLATFLQGTRPAFHPFEVSW